MIDIRPYFNAVASPRSTVIVGVAFVATVLLSHVETPIRVSYLPWNEQIYRRLGSLTMALAATAVVSTLAIADRVALPTASRSLFVPQMVHLGVLGTALMLFSESPLIADGNAGVRPWVVTGMYLIAALLSLLILGEFGTWAGPTLMLAAQVIPIPVSGDIAAWQERSSWPYAPIATIATLVGVFCVFTRRRHPSKANGEQPSLARRFKISG